MNILNKFKRGLAGLLSLSVAVSAVFVFHFPLIRAYAADEHSSHSICGGSSCSGAHNEHADNVTWTKWEITDSLPAAEDFPEESVTGYFFLADDVTISTTWEPADGTYLCLNGHSITMTGGGAVISVESEFTLCDCKNNNGTITHEEVEGEIVKGSGVDVGINGSFNMYGGKISRNTTTEEKDGGGVAVSGVFNMYDGEISGNTATGDGGGVAVSGVFNMYDGKISENKAGVNGGGVGNGGEFNVYGGTISKNSATEQGGGAYSYTNGSMTVGGAAKITGNTGSNVFLPTSFEIIHIDSNNPLKDGASIGVMAEDFLPKEGEEPDDSEKKPEDLPIAQFDDNDDDDVGDVGDYEDYYQFFSSDVDGINISYVNKDNDEGKEAGIVLTYGEAPGKPEEPSKPDVSSEPSKPDSSEPSKPDSGEPSNPDSGDSGNTGNDNNDDKQHHKNDTNAWKPFDKAAFESESGFYYLENDVELEDTLKPADKTYLCLNGKKLSIGGDKPVISVTGKFTLCDDEGGGIVTHGQGGGVGVSVANTGKFAMFGGTISGNKNHGVTIEGNGTLTVGGTAKILDEVYLLDEQFITIDDKKPLEGDAKIKVKLANELQPGEKVAVAYTNGTNVTNTKFFESENEDYSIENGADNEVIFAKPKDGEHKHGSTEFEPIASEDELIAATEGNYYYLKNDITLTQAWTPAKNVYLCLNGKTITGTISVTESGVTLYNCKSTGSANVTVSADKTINVGGNLKANITLNDGALINVDSNYKLTTGASITVALGKALADGESKAITTANNGGYSTYFHSANSSYTKKISGSAVVFEKPKKEEPPMVGHIHPICGIDNCRDHIDLEWTEWNSSTTLPTTAGSYYLTGNVTLSSRWNAASDIDICLNGFTITMNANDTAVYVTHDLALCDCNTRSSEGAVTHASGKTGRGVYIASGGAFTMYGGTIKNNRTADGAGVYNDGTFTMRGGDITGNTATNSGGGLYNNGVAEIEGSIFKNSASEKGGGVYQDGKFTVNKDAYIMNNTVGSSSRNNVYLTDGSQIVIGGTSFDGEVGVTLETNPRSSESVIFAKGSISSSTAKKLVSDSSSYTVKASGGRLTLSKKSTTTSVDDDDSDLELEISAPLSSASIPQADRTAIINLLKTMPEWVVGVYYDVTLYEDGDEISEADESISVKLTIPTSIRAANRVYKVIRVHDGKAELLDSTTDSNRNTITVKSRYFSTYAIIYSASQSSSGNGSGSGSNGGYVNPAMGVQNEIPLAGLACGFTVLALAAPGKKLDQ